jgi:hypothetical protein
MVPEQSAPAPIKYDLNNPPMMLPGKRRATRRVWGAAVAQYLTALGAGVGLDPARQRITSVVDAREMVTQVRLTHPLLEIAADVRQGGDGVGLSYQPGPESPIWTTRGPDAVQYSGVFRDATAPSCHRLTHRMRWLAGLEDCAVSPRARQDALECLRRFAQRPAQRQRPSEYPDEEIGRIFAGEGAEATAADVRLNCRFAVQSL